MDCLDSQSSIYEWALCCLLTEHQDTAAFALLSSDAWLVANIAQLQCAGGIATFLENSPIISFIILNCYILSKIEKDNSQECSKMCMR